ncbi:MAG: FlgD immunoglobulin-like domain containing protein, partial [Brevinematales bacterium]
MASGETNILPVLLADFGRVKGVVLPGFANPSVKLYQKGTSILAKDKFSNEVVAGADLEGRYLLDFVPPGEYDIGFIGKNYTETRRSGIVVLSNMVTNIGTNKMEHDLLSPDATGDQEVVCLDDLETAISFPAGTIGENFRLDIWITNMTGEQQEATEKKPIQAPLDKPNAKAWVFVIRNAKGEEQPEQWLKNDATIKIAYDPAYISGQGWDEDKLSIYYWRATTKQWVKLGGKVDRDSHTIRVKVSYLHKYYTVMADSVEKAKPGFVSVKVDPKVFTPRRGGREVQNMKLAVVFEKPVERYVVRIYDLKGNLVYKVERSGMYGNGEVFWDGKDLSGYDVPGGVYV